MKTGHVAVCYWCHRCSWTALRWSWMWGHRGRPSSLEITKTWQTRSKHKKNDSTQTEHLNKRFQRENARMRISTFMKNIVFWCFLLFPKFENNLVTRWQVFALRRHPQSHVELFGKPFCHILSTYSGKYVVFLWQAFNPITFSCVHYFNWYKFVVFSVCIFFCRYHQSSCYQISIPLLLLLSGRKHMTGCSWAETVIRYPTL